MRGSDLQCRYLRRRSEKELANVVDETGGEGVCIVVRLETPPVEGTFFHLSAKFGAKPADAAQLLRAASANGCQVGLAFHVGSQCLVPGAYRDALRIVGETVEAARTPLHILDVGGGFPATYAAASCPAIEDYMMIEAGVGSGSARLHSDAGRAQPGSHAIDLPRSAAQGQPALSMTGSTALSTRWWWRRSACRPAWCTFDGDHGLSQPFIRTARRDSLTSCRYFDLRPYRRRRLDRRSMHGAIPTRRRPISTASTRKR